MQTMTITPIEAITDSTRNFFEFTIDSYSIIKIFDTVKNEIREIAAINVSIFDDYLIIDGKQFRIVHMITT